MCPGIVLRELAISVKSSDDSYMPRNVTVSVGNSESSLREIKKLTIPRETTGRFMLVQNLSTEYSFVQVNIKACHNDGCDARVHHLHALGCK